MKTLHELRLPYQKNIDLESAVSSYLEIDPNQIQSLRTLKRSLDARNRKQLYWVYSIEVYFKGESPENLSEKFPQLKWSDSPPLIIGAGPAGLFAAWTLLKHGIRPILLEQGERTHERMLKISRYWRHGVLDPNSNVCNGEGGAGTFSDGKLITRIKSPLIPRVMQAFVDYGAPEEIRHVYNPHVGSNLIREVIKKMSDDLIQKGADLRFNHRVEELDFSAGKLRGVYLQNGDHLAGSGLILACGHSSTELFQTLHRQGVLIEPKPFALGLRIEHPQSYINQWQYGAHAENKDLETAQYKMTHYWDQEKIGVYTFCMCPGGYVISSTTDPETIVVNGMSNYHRNSHWANSAVVCSIDLDKVPGNDPFKMMNFQREIEKKVYQSASNPKNIPAQRLEDFFQDRKSSKLPRSSSPSGITSVNLRETLPDWINEKLKQGLQAFDQKRPGFYYPDAILHAVESRTSSPVRISRDPNTMESIRTPGLFPCGEGPGYAGGITSAAVDGMNAALAWIKKFIRIQ